MIVRLFVEASAAEAAQIGERLREFVAAITARAHLTSVRPYWKISGYQELLLEIDATGDPAQAISTVTNRLGSGWTDQSGQDRIWNPGPDASFIEPQVRWAHAELVD